MLATCSPVPAPRDDDVVGGLEHDLIVVWAGSDARRFVVIWARRRLRKSDMRVPHHRKGVERFRGWLREFQVEWNLKWSPGVQNLKAGLRGESTLGEECRKPCLSSSWCGVYLTRRHILGRTIHGG